MKAFSKLNGLAAEFNFETNTSYESLNVVHSFKDAMSQLIQSNVNEEKTAMKFEINQCIETYANSPVQNDVLDYWKNMSTSIKLIERVVFSLAKYFFTPLC